MNFVTSYFISGCLYKYCRSVALYDLLGFFNTKIFKVDGLGYFVVTSKYEMAQYVQSMEMRRAGTKERKSRTSDWRRVTKALQVLERLEFVRLVRDAKTEQKVLNSYKGQRENSRKNRIYNVTGLVLLKEFLWEVDRLQSSSQDRNLGYGLILTLVEAVHAEKNIMRAMYSTIRKYAKKLQNHPSSNLLTTGRKLRFYLNGSQKNRSATTQATP